MTKDEAYTKIRKLVTKEGREPFDRLMDVMTFMEDDYKREIKELEETN